MAIDSMGFAYAATVAVAGMMGYYKAKSIPSLAAGLVFGSLLGFGAYQTSRNPNNVYLSLGTSTFLAGLMAYRVWVSGKVFPGAFVASLSLANAIRLSSTILSQNRKMLKEN